MTRLRMFLPVLMLVLGLQFVRVEAHVAVTDDSGAIGSIVHIAPDDDPVAGQSSTIHFTVQSDSFSQHSHDASLRIIDEQDHVVTVPSTLAGSTATTAYTFPRQGVYALEFVARAQPVPDSATAEHEHVFEHTIRVARGTAIATQTPPNYAWADVGLVVGVVGLILLGVIGINRRDEIAKYSQWHH